ncbi:MAG: hypothetical protein HRU41_36655 [Saprospiraceae bacterium]|nr:hypothetical protein [Saprospiraceae bacterium]
MKNTKIKVQIVSNDFSTATKEEMWTVYSKFYDYSKEYFMQRIHKNNYFSLYTVDGKIIGFTGLRIDRPRIQGRRHLLIYFGQTIIDHAYRGKSLIPTTGAKLCLRYLPEMLTSKTYFWADCLTYKAYLVFAKTLEQYYPSYKEALPSKTKTVIDFIGQRHYSGTYCSTTGTVRKDTVVVNDASTTRIPMKYRQDQDIQFFTQANPLFMEGHGLLTLGPVNFTNFGILMKRLFQKVVGINRRPKTALPQRPKVRKVS